ncbi:hypothetical protein BGZ65_007862 [Modicella reniformis]|uniref:SPX domain-containing protein n=1 Tax=Modicella reniformis TaxID=1440133 RepID=A0A9P6IJ64_9FUNG|nr:hypothetical protein BGZ65_007862 [Modicella reniformis]
MKFGKSLETNAESMPEGWRPYVIHYKELKRKINDIVKELDDRGLPSPIIKNLLSETMSGNLHRGEYSFDEDKKHLKTCIKVVIDDLDANADNAYGPEPLSQAEQFSKLLAHERLFLNMSASSSSSDLYDRLLPGEEGVEEAQTYRLQDILDDETTASEASEIFEDTLENVEDMGATSHATTPMLVDAFSSTAVQERAGVTTHGPDPGTLNLSATSTSKSCTPSSPLPHLQPDYIHPESSLQPEAAFSSFLRPSSPPSSSCSVTPPSSLSPDTEQETASISSTPIETLVTPGVMHEQRSAAMDYSEIPAIDQDNTGTSVIHTMEEDGKKVLVIELTADTAFFDQLGEEVSQLGKLQRANKQLFESKVEDLSNILTAVSSPHNKDMYTWREILKFYLDAQVFVGDQEADRSTRSSEKAQKQLDWFMDQLNHSKLTHKFKQSKSKMAFKAFFQLNSELVIMKQFRELNQMAMTKILKKHDKRTNLTASFDFPKHLQNEPFYNDNISKSLTYTIANQLLSIIPQPDDYACPICMSVAWKPIRLKCTHVFCVRCLIKAQRKKMIHCPVCRQPNSVLEADASNLDVSMMNFMKLYFPKEIKEKRKESSKELAREELEALTGQRWSESPEAAVCIIM